MSSESNKPDGERAGDDFEHALQSLKPRSTIDPASILAQVMRDEPTRPQSSRSQSRTNWWPLLTALSWLVTAIVWWSSTRAISPRDDAADRSNSPTTPIRLAVVVPEHEDSHPAADRLGGSLIANGAQVVESEAPPIHVNEPATSTGPHWLARLGVDVPGFGPEAAEKRWQQMQAQADVIARAEGEGTGDRGRDAATYSSLREEFDTPIRRNWFSR